MANRALAPTSKLACEQWVAEEVVITPNSANPLRWPSGRGGGLGPWCAACKATDRLLNEVAAGVAGRVQFAESDVDQSPGIPERFRFVLSPASLQRRAGGGQEDAVMWRIVDEERQPLGPRDPVANHLPDGHGQFV